MPKILDFLRKIFGEKKRSLPKSEIDYSAHDPEALQRLLERINRQGDLRDWAIPRPLVTLEEFFEGNSDYSSIGYNLIPPPSPQEFYDLFRSIREKSEVFDVRVQVNGQEESESWPWSDTIWIITSAEAEEVEHWLGERFQADAPLTIGFEQDCRKLEKYQLPEGMNAIGVWWD